MRRELSLAEEQGWRSFWDGFTICPDCKKAKLDSGYYRRSDRSEDGWGVPPDYDTPIGENREDYPQAGRCLHCRALPPLELTWKTQAAA